MRLSAVKVIMSSSFPEATDPGTVLSWLRRSFDAACVGGIFFEVSAAIHWQHGSSSRQDGLLTILLAENQPDDLRK